MNRHVFSTSTHAVQPIGFRLFAIVLAAGLGMTAGCVRDERLSNAEFSDRLQQIHQEGSEHWGRLAEQAEDLQPGDPITGELEQVISELIAFQRRAADQLGAPTAPATAEEDVEMLRAALQERTEALEEALEAQRFTVEQFDRITEAGDRIAAALSQLRDKGFLANAEDHDPH